MALSMAPAMARICDPSNSHIEQHLNVDIWSCIRASSRPLTAWQLCSQTFFAKLYFGLQQVSELWWSVDYDWLPCQEHGEGVVNYMC